MAGYINISGTWKRVKEAYIKIAGYTDTIPVPPFFVTVPPQWKKAKEIWLNIGDNVWKKVFPTVITPVIENQVELTSSTAAASGRTILTGKYYHWIDGDTITYFFERVSPSFGAVSSAVVTNPNVGTSSTVSYIVPQSDVVVSSTPVDNEYRFRVNAINAETNGSADSYNTQATNVIINVPRNITNLSAYFIGTDTIGIQWTSGFYTESFRVEYKRSTDSTYTIYDHYNYSPISNSALIPGLISGTSYDFQVTPYTGARVDSTSSKGYYGNSSTVSATTATPPGNVTNGFVILNPATTLGSTSNISQIASDSANYLLVTVSTEDFVKDNSSVTISGATGSQSVVNGTWLTVSHPDRSKFFIYNPNGTWGSITTQNYSSGCTARYLNRVTPYTATLYWTAGSNTTGYELTLSISDASTFDFQTVTLGAVSSYSFSSVGSTTNTKNKYFTASITPYNGSIAGSSYSFSTAGARALPPSTSNVAFNTESAVNTVAASFVKVSGYGTAASPWQGDIYALTPGTWIFNGDGSANTKIYLRDWSVDTGSDYLVYSGFAIYFVTSRPFSIPSFYNYQIPNNSVYGSPLYMASILANDSTLDAVFPGDEGLGKYSFAQTGDVNRLRGPGSGSGESTAGKTDSNLRFLIYDNSPNPPYWAYFYGRYTPAVVNGNGVYTITTTQTVLSNAVSNPDVLNISSLTSASWYFVSIYGYNNGVFSYENNIFTQTYTKATALPSAPTGSEFYMERSGNTLYWWKIADSYTNVHLIWIRMDRYVGGVYQNSYDYYFFPYFYTVTSNLSGYPNNPSTSIRYSIDLSSLPSGTYYPFLGFYNYDFGFGPGPVQTNYVGTTYPFTK